MYSKDVLFFFRQGLILHTGGANTHSPLLFSILIHTEFKLVNNSIICYRNSPLWHPRRAVLINRVFLINVHYAFSLAALKLKHIPIPLFPMTGNFVLSSFLWILRRTHINLWKLFEIFFPLELCCYFWIMPFIMYCFNDISTIRKTNNDCYIFK